MSREIVTVLNKNDKFELQNIMLRIQVEVEKINNINMQQMQANERMNFWQNKLNELTNAFEEHLLKSRGLTIKDVDIDAETGEIILINKNVVNLEQKVEGNK